MKDSIENVLKALLSSDEDARKKAIEDLDSLKCDLGDLSLLYEAIERPYPDDNDRDFSTRSRLLYKLFDAHDRTTVGFIENVFTSLPQANSLVLSSALRVLTEMATDESISSFLEMMHRHRPVLTADDFYMVMMPLFKNSIKAVPLFPSLFGLLDRKEYKYEVYALAVECRNAGHIEDDIFEGLKPLILADYKAALIKRERYPQEDEEYERAEDLMIITLCCLGSFPEDKESVRTLHAASVSSEPILSLAATEELIHSDEEVSREVINALARSPVTRARIYQALEDAELEEQYPENMLTQVAFAEADLVQWLMHPNEHGKPPDFISLMDTREIDVNGVISTYYLYKYFYADDPAGWMVGLSGPQPTSPDEFEFQGDHTFSNYKKVNELSIDDHYKSILEVVTKVQ